MDSAPQDVSLSFRKGLPPEALPAPGEVLLGRTSLDVPTEPFEPLLSADERERAERFRFDAHRRRFVVARGTLRRFLGAEIGRDPASLRFVLGPRGKPSLADAPDLQFNVSHSVDLALVACTRGRRVGVDLEQVVPLDDLLGMARRTFSRAETAALEAIPEADRLLAFHLAWTRKEAFVKAVGDGLSFPLDSFDVSLAPGEPARILAIRDAERARESWSLVHLDAAPGFAAALVVEGARPVVRTFRADAAS